MDKEYYLSMMGFFWEAMCLAQEIGEPTAEYFDSFTRYNDLYRSAK